MGKLARGQYLGLIQGKTLEIIPFRKSHPSGALRVVWNLFQASKDCPRKTRISLSLLSLGRVVTIKPIIDLSSIIDPFKGSEHRMKDLKLLLESFPFKFLKGAPSRLPRKEV